MCEPILWYLICDGWLLSERHASVPHFRWFLSGCLRLLVRLPTFASSTRPTLSLLVMTKQQNNTSKSVSHVAADGWSVLVLGPFWSSWHIGNLLLLITVPTPTREWVCPFSVSTSNIYSLCLFAYLRSDVQWYAVYTRPVSAQTLCYRC
jgi:hypothetical protein